jgi:hypothetical protein
MPTRNDTAVAVEPRSRARRLVSGLGWWDALATPGTGRMLALNALIDSAGTGLAAVSLPVYLLRVVHLSPSEFALVLAAGGVAELAMSVPAGSLAGRLGLWRYAIATRWSRAVLYAVFAFTTSMWLLLALSVTIGALRAAGNGLNQSMTAEVVGPEQRGDTLAVTRAVRNLGYLVSGALGVLVLAAPSDVPLRMALVANGLSFVVGALLLMRIRPRTGSAAGDPRAVGRRMDFSVLRDVRYLGLIACAAVFASTVRVLDVALPLFVLREAGVPLGIVAGIVTLNTLLVVMLQHRFSRWVTDPPSALRALRWSALSLAAMAVVLALLPGRPAAVVAVGLTLAGLLLTIGELTESPAWWTLSFSFAPAGRSSEYLAAFDLNYALLNILGPPLLIVVVEHGTAGWLGYACAVAAATQLAHLWARRRPTAGG